MNGAADMAVTVVLVALLGWLGWKFLLWMADKVIGAIDWMTRGER